MRATFYLEDREVHTADIPGTSTPVPIVVGENSPLMSANVRIPADVVEPGLEMVIEIDPDGTLDEELGVAARIPDEGRLEAEVESVPAFELTVIPFLWEEDPDSAILEIDADNPTMIARDGAGGRIRAFWSGWRDSSDSHPEWVLLRSRGLPGREEWARRSGAKR